MRAEETQKGQTPLRHVQTGATTANLAVAAANFILVPWECLTILPYSAVVGNWADFELAGRLLQDKESACLIYRGQT